MKMIGLFFLVLFHGQIFAQGDEAAGYIARSVFTLDIHESEPVDNILSLGNRHYRIYYFTDLRGLAGQVVLHRWEYAGKVMAEVPFHIQGDRWRVWSSKNLAAEWLGEWKVSVVDENGRALNSDTFEYTQSVAIQ